MKLDGIHHITAITADAQANVDFYSGLLGLRFVKRTVNFDAPEFYHLYYADEVGSPGTVLTFFEYPGAARGIAGPGMIHRIVWRVADETSLDFWTKRLEAAGFDSERSEERLTLADSEGLGLEFVVDDGRDAPKVARSADVPEEHALLGFEGVRAYSPIPGASDALLSDTLGFASDEPGAYIVEGTSRHSTYAYDLPPSSRGIQGAGTVHHIAWASAPEDHATWRERVAGAGADVTPIIDRTYFRSIYFREPSGVLFEIATIGPGFTVDEPLEALGEALRLPPQHEYLRPRLERELTPITLPAR
ncbi:MAG: VOC family protein [Actinomycetota bacterium]